MIVAAKLENLEPMLSCIEAAAEKLGFDHKKINQVRLAAEEILVNIINYAYPGEEGKIEVNCRQREGKALEIEIADWGFAFDPLAMATPDITLPLEKRGIGGLGVFLVRKLMDEVTYKRQDDRNILTIVKY